MEANRNSNLLKFRQKCIHDYTFFIATFFRLLDPPNNKKYSSDAAKFIIRYLHFKEIEEDLPLREINKKNLQSFLNSYGKRGELLTGQYFRLNKAGGGKRPPGLNLAGIASHRDNKQSQNSNEPTVRLGSNIGGLTFNNTHDPGNFIFELEYPNIFNNSEYKPFKASTGVQSSMKVNNKNNPRYYLKTVDPKNPDGSLNALKNECKIFYYLYQKNRFFLENFTCFVRCYKNGILLRNGGIVLSSQLKSQTFEFNAQNIQNLLNFFSILLELHKLLITHNDLKVDNIVGFDRNDVRIIDFGQSEIHLEEFYDELFFNHMDRVFKTIFFALLQKNGLIH